MQGLGVDLFGVEGGVGFDYQVTDSTPQEQVVVLLEVEELEEFPPTRVEGLGCRG